MRDILKKVTTGSMIAGAALLVAACGGDTAANNTATTDLGNDTTMDMNTDMGMDMNTSTDLNAGTTDMNAGTTDMNASMSTDTNATPYGESWANFKEHDEPRPEPLGRRGERRIPRCPRRRLEPVPDAVAIGPTKP